MSLPLLSDNGDSMIFIDLLLWKGKGERRRERAGAQPGGLLGLSST